MKHGGLKVICLIIWACIMVLPAFGQRTVNWESIILESFNGDDDAQYVWRAQASRFITRTDEMEFPVLQHIEAWPAAAFGFNRGDAPPIRSLGVWGRFNRPGFNWIDIFPTSPDDDEGRPVEIPIPGRVQSIDMWVWGSNLRYFIDVYLRDYRGVVHTLRLGDLAFAGWRNLSVNVPTNIVQTRRTLPSHAGLSFVKFRIWTTPPERVDNFFIYFNQLRVLTDTFQTLFDGNDLADPNNVQRLWAQD